MLVNSLFAGPYKLWKETNCKVVPVITFTEAGDKNAYIRVVDPIDFSGKTKDEALTMLRDVMATEMWDMMERNATKIERKSIDIHQARMPNHWSRYLTLQDLGMRMHVVNLLLKI